MDLGGISLLQTTGYEAHCGIHHADTQQKLTVPVALIYSPFSLKKKPCLSLGKFPGSFPFIIVSAYVCIMI